MEAEEVLGVYAGLAEAGAAVWVDGGWCVDALLGRQSREHPDLDVAVASEHVARLVEALAARALAQRYGFEIPATHRGAAS